jgi:hypothetical protein
VWKNSVRVSASHSGRLHDGCDSTRVLSPVGFIAAIQIRYCGHYLRASWSHVFGPYCHLVNRFRNVVHLLMPLKTYGIYPRSFRQA